MEQDTFKAVKSMKVVNVHVTCESLIAIYSYTDSCNFGTKEDYGNTIHES